MHFQATSGDFPSVLYEVVSKRSSVVKGSLSIDELNEVLDSLAENLGHSYVVPLACSTSLPDRVSRDIQAKLMQRVYNRTTPEEQRWIIRIILKGYADNRRYSHRYSSLSFQT